MKRTRFKRDECDYVGQITRELRKRHSLCMMLPRRLCETTGDDSPIPDEHTTDGRIWKAAWQRPATLQQREMHETSCKIRHARRFERGCGR
jgi:hypothetical protein